MSSFLKNHIVLAITVSCCHRNKGVVANWLAHWPLELEVLGSIPCVGKGIPVSEHAFLRVICRDDMKTVRRPSDWDVNLSPDPSAPVH